MYKFDEVLGLFNLQNRTEISEEDIKNAKLMVLKMHPDKSRLPPDYFLFYKKAFDIVYEFYQNQSRITKPVPKEEVKYNSYGRGIDSGLNKAANRQIQTTISKMDSQQFGTVFNELFEKNMLNAEKQHRDQERTKWFRTEDEPPEIHAGNGTINEKIERIKEQQSHMMLSQYQGVQTLYTGGGGIQSGNVYDDDQDDIGSTYITSDPFSKLKYDDLRKVHKDQTIFAVSEKKAVIPNHSIDQIQQLRSTQDIRPMGKSESIQMMEEQERRYREQMMKKEYAAKLQTMQYEEKAKAVRSHFLQLR
jgi:hypothetical protein